MCEVFSESLTKKMVLGFPCDARVYGKKEVYVCEDNVGKSHKE